MILLRFKLKYLLLIPVDLLMMFSGYALCFLLWNLNLTEYKVVPVIDPLRYIPLICAIAAIYLIIYFLFDMYNLSQIFSQYFLQISLRLFSLLY